MAEQQTEPLHRTARVDRVGLSLDVDPNEIERKKEVKNLRLNVFEIPLLRIVGFALLSLGVALHGLYLAPPLDLSNWLLFTLTAAVYSLASWVILYLYVPRLREFDLGLLFLILDVPVMLLAIYATGGDRSWLFFAPLMRVVDQVNTTLKRALGFAHYVTLGYIAMMFWIVFVEGREISMPIVVTKTIFIYGTALYVALSAKAAAARRAKTTAAIRMARNLIRQLEEKSRQLEDLRIKAEEASQAKSEFLANMSHEMRTPLNAILGMTQITLDSELSAEQRQSLETVRESAESLLTVINDVLDFSKIEARKLDLELVEFNLRDTLYGIIKTLGFHAYRKGLELVCHVNSDVPDALVGDPQRLRQVVINLVGNAIKFTERGEVALVVQIASVRQDKVTLHYTVSDTGIGIPEEKQKLIFDAFVQADGSYTRKYGGTGLGLSISSRLIELMDGAIWVESEPGRGSAFHFTTRFHLQPQPAQPEPRPKLDGRVLVADDSASSREIVREMLRAFQMQVTEAEDGRAALAAIDSAQAQGTPFSALVLDVAMPEADGFSVLQRARNWAEKTVMMLPHAGDLRGAARCRELGVATYISKPVTERELLESMRTALGVADTAAKPTQRGPYRTARPLRVLVAEDNPVNQAVARRLLERWGHDVSVAFDGREVMSALEHEKFDLILMDVQMPEMDGFQATHEIRRREAGTGQRMPIVAMTAHAMKGDRDRCFEAGMDAYIVKPIDQSELFEVLEWFGSSRKPGDQPPTRTAEPADTTSQRDSLLAHFDHDENFAKSVSQLFLDNYPRMLAEIRGAIERGDAEALKRSAHTLKGAIGNFPPAEPAFKAAARLEMMGHNRDLADAEKAYENLVVEIENFKPTLAVFL